MIVSPEVLFANTAKYNMRVLCLSIWYPLSMSRYFEKALRYRNDIDLITVGPYTGNWIPWLGGMTVPDKYAIPPDIPLDLPPNIGMVSYDLVKKFLPSGWEPDIILTIDAGIHWKDRPSGNGQVVHIATDPHVLDYTYQRIMSDKFFNMQACYSQKNDIYLPYAYSQYDHYPEDEIVTLESIRGYKDPLPIGGIYPKDVDAVLIGMPYEQRVQWVDALRRRGVKVIFENGPIFDEARALYNRGRIGLNWSSMNDLNARAFEIPAMKLYPIMNLVSDLHKFDFSQHVDVFADLQGAIEKVMWAVEHPEETKNHAEKAYRSVQGQTYDARITELLKECGFG